LDNRSRWRFDNENKKDIYKLYCVGRQKKFERLRRQKSRVADIEKSVERKVLKLKNFALNSMKYGLNELIFVDLCVL